MKIVQLRYFQRVCRYQSITKAAEEMYVSQPAISFCIKQLEEEFGVKLFLRRNNKLQLTTEGQYFLEKVNFILNSVDSLTAQMKDMGSNRNHVKIAMPAMVSTFLFPALFNAHSKQFPTVELEMLETSSLQVTKLVDSGSVDLGVTIYDPALHEDYNVLPLMDTELMFCVNKNHSLAKATTLTYKDLQHEHVILFKADSDQNVQIKRAFKEEDVEPNIRLYSSQLYTIKEILSYGNTGAFLYKQIGELNSDLVCIPMQNPVKQKFVLVWAKNTSMYTDTENFINFAKTFKYQQGE
ncbi:MAG: LysR family transcriptional regulator [Clostridia bacterium]|nr:LysR family transcriptional regulator [Clostridia bacterium]